MQRWNFNLFLVQQFQNVFFQFNLDGGKTINLSISTLKNLVITTVIICITVKLTDVDSSKECKY
jgi:hypothetical protein